MAMTFLIWVDDWDRKLEVAIVDLQQDYFIAVVVLQNPNFEILLEVIGWVADILVFEADGNGR